MSEKENNLEENNKPSEIGATDKTGEVIAGFLFTDLTTIDTLKKKYPEVRARGTDVFSSEHFRITRLNSEIQVFNFKTPLQVLQEEGGINTILDELGRIEHGVLA